MAKASSADLWLKHLLMMRRGVGRDRQGALHELTEVKQRKYHYTVRPYSEPIVTVTPSDSLVIVTRAARGRDPYRQS